MVVLRPWAWQRLLMALCLIIVALGLAGGGAAGGGWLEPAGWVAAALMLPVAWRVDRERVELRPDAVVVVNFFRTLVIPWTEIHRFDYGLGALVIRSDRRAHRIDIFTPQRLDLPFVRRQCENAVREMEEFREHRLRLAGGHVAVG